MFYTYSRWTGTPHGDGLGPDQIVDALADELISDGNVDAALQHVMRWGLQPANGPRVRGSQDILNQVRAARDEELERYDLHSMARDIERAITDVVRAEREGLERKLERSRRLDTEQRDAGRQALESLAEHKNGFLDALPRDPGAAIGHLSEYEFFDDAARLAFDSLMGMLERQVVLTNFRTTQQSLNGPTAQGAGELPRVNEALEDDASDDRCFERFMARQGSRFPGVYTFDQLVEGLHEQGGQTEDVLGNITVDMRRTLELALRSVLRHTRAPDEMARLAQLLQVRRGSVESPQRYSFSGEHELNFDEARRLLRRLHELDRLEQALTDAEEAGTLDGVESREVGDLLGEEWLQATECIKALPRLLEDAGYIAASGAGMQLTVRGIRRLGHKALRDIFRHLEGNRFGDHPHRSGGVGVDIAEDTKPYEFGDPFHLDLRGTLRNALSRGPSDGSVGLRVDDFEVFRTDQRARATTVLMVDMSRSMPLRGCFAAAKKVVLALNSLISARFPRDDLYVVGFSDRARLLRPETLLGIVQGRGVHGTNMQHGFALARRLLARHKRGNRQIILITDGEPTASCEQDGLHVAFPPTVKIFEATLREVKRCAQEGIVINTFMLDRSPASTDFVDQIARVNGGRTFFATPERLGDYVLVDYIRRKQTSRG